MPSTAGFGTQGQFNRMGYIYISLVNSALVLLCGLISIIGTIKRVRSMPHYDEAVESEHNIKKSLGDKIENENDEKANVDGKIRKRKKRHGELFSDLGHIMAGYVETFKKSDFRTVMLGYSVSLIASVFITSVGMHLFTFCRVFKFQF